MEWAPVGSITMLQVQRSALTREGGYDLSRVNYRHGGDFRGIIERLDYIKSLGYTAIWISPRRLLINSAQ